MAESGQSRKKSKAKFDFLKHRNSKTKIQHVANDALYHIDTVKDPRTRPCDYPLREILFIAAVAYLCDAESYEDIATFGRAQIEWFRQFIPLENGIPSRYLPANLYAPQAASIRRNVQGNVSRTVCRQTRQSPCYRRKSITRLLPRQRKIIAQHGVCL